MKIRLNKKTLSEMPEKVRAIVSEWKGRYGKAFISVENVTQFFPGEDARVTLINLETEKDASARVGGEFAGNTGFSPCSAVPLRPGIAAVVQGIFCGLPWLTVYQGSAPQIKA